MHTYLIDLLQCPRCHGELAWRIDEREREHIEAGEATCAACGAAYPVRDGIGLFLTPDLPRNDLWERSESGLLQVLSQHPELERQLTEPPLTALNPADQVFRAMVLEERGAYAAAQQADELALQGLYTPEYRRCWDRQVEYVIECLAATQGPIVDLASGRCYLVGKLARVLERPVVATDFSPRVQRRNRRWLAQAGLYDRVSLLALDARRTPFRDRAVAKLTTNLGLPNIERPGDLLVELRRIVGGAFWAISHFYRDQANLLAIQKMGLEVLLDRQQTLASFAAAGWEVRVENTCLGLARPTPVSAVLEGASVDALPVVETELEWCVLVATGQATA